MTQEQIRNIVIAIYAAINAKDETTLRRLFAADIIRHATGEIGVEAAIKMMEKMFSANPKTYFIIEDILVDGNKVAIRVAIHGRESSPEKPPSTILEIFRIENNQAVEIWGAGISPERFPTKS
jgi:predicted ester cyclase